MSDRRAAAERAARILYGHRRGGTILPILPTLRLLERAYLAGWDAAKKARRDSES